MAAVDENNVYAVLPSRRRFIVGLAGIAGAAAGGGRLCAAEAIEGVHRFRVGAAEITVLSDGQMTLPTSFVLPGRATDEITSVVAGRTTVGFASAGGIIAPVNVALVQIGDALVLIDSGGGPDYLPGLGQLADRLEAAGVKPQSVTHVVFTHAHADHLWGVVDPLGDGSLFENAKHVMSAAERDYWMQADIEAKVPDAFRAMALGTRRRLGGLGDRIGVMSGEHEIAPGLAVMPTPGHTPGHVSLVVRSGTEQLIIGGDALSQAAISFERPDWTWGPDMDGDLAIATRKRLLDRLATEKSVLLGYHLPWPGLGRVERTGTGYRLVAT